MAEQKMYNAALVLQGGGTRGAYTAGVIDVLMEEGIDFPYLIGTSAGALNGVDFYPKILGVPNSSPPNSSASPRCFPLGISEKPGTSST
jgi:predicted patatin/cPLA2 family phospholipase